MKIDKNKMELALARAVKTRNDLRGIVSPCTLVRIYNKPNCEVTTKTAGKIAQALGVDVTDIMKED